MDLHVSDYNGADTTIFKYCQQEWSELEKVLSAMPLHLKASDQAGIQGKPIFDPVGTNEYIRMQLQAIGWQYAIPIPTEYEFLGTNSQPMLTQAI